MKHLTGHRHTYLMDVACFLLTLLYDLPGRSLAVVIHSESDRGQSRSDPQVIHSFPWVDFDIDIDTSEIGSPLSRDRREANVTTGSKSVWETIEEFYSDKNNMAMFCVLPILILIYGGCSSIYCIHKCRHYIRGRKHKRLKEQDCHSVDPGRSQTRKDITGNSSIHESRNQPLSHISSAWTDLQIDTNDSGWSEHTKGQTLGRSGYSPLSWLAAGREDPNSRNENVSCAGELEDILQTDDVSDIGKRDSKLSNERHQNNRSSTDAFILDRGKQTPHHPASSPNVPVRSIDPRPFEQTRTHVNLADYTTKGKDNQYIWNKAGCRRWRLSVKAGHGQPPGPQSEELSLELFSQIPQLRASPDVFGPFRESTCLKAADYSRFSESRSIEIIPLSAAPILSIWHPLHNKTSREGRGKPYDLTGNPRIAGATKHDIKGGPEIAILDLKKGMLTKYDAMPTLNPYITEKNPRKPASKKHIFITE